MNEVCKYKNKNWLSNQYINMNKKDWQIANNEKVSTTTIKNWLKRFKIKKPIPNYHNYDWLYNEFVILNKSKKEIGEEQNISEYTIKYWI